MDWQNIFAFTKGGTREGSKGALSELSSDPLDSSLFVQLGGKYRAATLAGRMFSGCNTAVKTTVAGVTAAAWTGLGVANPTGSGIKIIIHEFNFAQWKIVTAGGILALATTTDAGFAYAIIPRNRMFGGPPSKAMLDDGATLTTAGVTEQHICSITTGAATVGSSPMIGNFDLHGSLVLLPGRSVITNTDAIQTSIFSFGFLWEEIPI